jgi:hypothetical protein
MKEIIQIKTFIRQIINILIMISLIVINRIIINKLRQILIIINNQLLNNNKIINQILEITINTNIIHQMIMDKSSNIINMKIKNNIKRTISQIIYNKPYR